jgi:hypothetical protein
MNDMSSTPASPRSVNADARDPIALMNELLTAQALALDDMFTELVGDAAQCKPYVETTEAWTRLALKAQANCRGSLEAMARAIDREARRALRENKK